MQPRMRMMHLDTFRNTEVTRPGSGLGNRTSFTLQPNLKELNKTGPNDRVARLVWSFNVALGLPDLTAERTIPGRRICEIVRRAQLRIPGWPWEMAFDCTGKTLRTRALVLRGHLASTDPANAVHLAGGGIAPGEAASGGFAFSNDYSDQRVLFVMDFWRPRWADVPGEATDQARCCPLAHQLAEGTLEIEIGTEGVGQGSLGMITFIELGGVDNTDRSNAGRLLAEVFTDRRDRVPLYTRVRERTYSSREQRLSLEPTEYLQHCWLTSRSAGDADHLAASFEADRIIEARIAGETVLEDVTIRELAECSDRELLTDAGGSNSPTDLQEGTLLENVHLFYNVRGPWTDAPRFVRRDELATRGQMQSAATGTGQGAPIVLVTDELCERR